MKATLMQFAAASDAAAGTSSKLRKQAILGEYFRTLEEADLRLAVRYAAGRAMAASDERTLNVGGAIVSDVLVELLRLGARELYAQVVRSGEVGEALAKIWRKSGAKPMLTLEELARGFEDLARSHLVENRREMLRDLFLRCVDGREAAYLAKIIFGDMRTGAQEGILAAAVAEAFGRELAAVQRCQLFVGDLEEVAILAKRDELSSARFRLFHPIQFMLATPQESALVAEKTMGGRAFFVEDKLDGIRAQVHKSGQEIAIYTRTMDRADESFPDVIGAMRKIEGEFLLDGEIVPYCDGCILPFAHIQRRLGRKRLSAAILRENPAVFVAFDVLYRAGRVLIDEPLRERRGQLEELRSRGLIGTKAREVSTAQQIAEAFEGARGRRNEGVVLKDPDSAYAPGRRGQAWLKIKTHLPTLDCVVTAAEHGHGKRRGVLSDYTFAVWDRDPAEAGARLVNVGKAYSGVTDEEIAQLTELFRSITLRQYGPVHIVEPKVVMEIAFDQIQKSTRHASGYALRFPRIKRLRCDKLPKDADRIERVEEIYKTPSNFGRGPVEEAKKEAAGLFDAMH